jgi:hypothetical protein
MYSKANAMHSGIDLGFDNFHNGLSNGITKLNIITGIPALFDLYTLYA